VNGTQFVQDIVAIPVVTPSYCGMNTGGRRFPINKFQNIIRNAKKDVASDVYLTGGHPMVVRKLGRIIFTNISYSHSEVDDLIDKLLNPEQVNLLRQKRSLDFATSISGVRLRINIFSTMRGYSLAIRLLSGHIPSIDDLNIHPSLKEIAQIKSGLVLNCGPTGVGKTTTMAAIINEINNTRDAHIITLENPIEYRFLSNKSFIQQRELGDNMPSFYQGLVDVLRESPDVIFVGELREAEVMQLTLNAAESGHLVLATMHASTPEEAIYRLCNSVSIESQNEVRFQLASSLKLLFVQQLVYLEKIGFRVPLLTIVNGNQAVKNIIRENKLHQLESAIQSGRNDGMFSSERYLNEYLGGRQNFIHPTDTFKPTDEKYNEIAYRSKLDEKPSEHNRGKMTVTQHTRADEPEPIIVRTRYDHEEVAGVLEINNDLSLEEMIDKLKR
jgi:twitching motility protein PilT